MAPANQGFRPAWWLPGPHAQTLGARLLRPRGGVHLRRERLETPDGDFLDLDWAESPTAGAAASRIPLVAVLHGLEGSARSKYALQTYRELRRRGLGAVGLNFRGCSGKPNRLPRMYHSGETSDLAWVLEQLHDRHPSRVLGAVGFSLGGNVLLKHLAERGLATPLVAAVAVSVPFDLAAGADAIERGFSRVYRRYLVRKLRRKVRAKATVLREYVAVDELLGARTFREFDDRGTAPLHGFVDAADYYRRSSSGPLLEAIRVPTLLIHSRDDPFLSHEAIPERRIAGNASLKAHIFDRGGHVGFVAGTPWNPTFWAEQAAASFLNERFSAIQTVRTPA